MDSCARPPRLANRGRPAQRLARAVLAVVLLAGGGAIAEGPSRDPPARAAPTAGISNAGLTAAPPASATAAPTAGGTTMSPAERAATPGSVLPIPGSPFGCPPVSAAFGAGGRLGADPAVPGRPAPQPGCP